MFFGHFCLIGLIRQDNSFLSIDIFIVSKFLRALFRKIREQTHKIGRPKTLFSPTKQTHAKMIMAAHHPSNSTLEPTAYDILLGRHKHCFHHVGNQAFRTLITQFMNHYATLTTKREKMHLVTFILNIIQQGGGRFLREGVSHWHAVKKRTAREKISHALRDHCTRIQFRNENSAIDSGDGSESTTMTAIASATATSASREVPQACWRTLVFETVQNTKSAKKSTMNAFPTDEHHYEHLDTKNHSFSLGHVHQQIAELQQKSNSSVEVTRRNLLNALAGSQSHAVTNMPFPHYFPTLAASQQQEMMYSLPNSKSTMNAFQDTRGMVNSQSMFMGDASKRMDILGASSTTMDASSSQQHKAHQATYHPPLNIPQKPRLVAARRNSLLSVFENDEDYSNETFAYAFDRFGGQNAMPTDGRQIGGGAIESFAANQGFADPADANIHDHQHHHHEEEHLIDPIPLHQLPADQFIEACPSPAPYFNDTHEAGARHRRESSCSADQHIDSMLLDLFKRG